METRSVSQASATTTTDTAGARLAKWSWLCFVIFFVTNFVGRATGLLIPAELICLAVMIVGTGLAVAGLMRIPRDGRRGILVPALVGLFLNLAFIIVWVTNFAATLARLRGRG